MARLYANENFPLPVVENLRRLGYDVLTTGESEKSGHAIPDEEVLAFASDEERAVLTLNRKHFVRLHHEKPRHAGVVACTFDPEFERQARRIHEAIDADPELTGRLLRVNRPA